MAKFSTARATELRSNNHECACPQTLTLSDGSTFHLEPDDIEWNPVPDDEAGVGAARAEVAALPDHQSALAELAHACVQSLADARRSIRQFIEYVLDVDATCTFTSLSGIDPIYRIDQTTQHISGVLNEALGQMTANAYARLATRTEDLNASRVWVSRRDEALRMIRAESVTE